MRAAFLVLLLSLPVAVAAAEVQVGNTLASVRATMGVPRGQLQIGGKQVLYFDRGEVELQAGAVTQVALLSPAEFAAVEAQRNAAAARAREENARLTAEGEALKSRKLADQIFLAAPLTYQLAFWQNFSVRYPGVDVSEQLAVAHLRVAELYNQQRAQEERVTELEARVAAAEARADAAEVPVYGYRGGYGYYAGYRGRQSSPLWPIEYHFSNTLGPIITPFNPNIVATVQRNTGSSYRNSNSNCDRRNSGRRGRM